MGAGWHQTPAHPGRRGCRGREGRLLPMMGGEVLRLVEVRLRLGCALWTLRLSRRDVSFLVVGGRSGGKTEWRGQGAAGPL